MVRITAIVCMAAGLLAACGSGNGPSPSSDASPDAAKAEPRAASCRLTVGWDPWEPYQYTAVDGSITGLDIEIASVLAADVGCKLSYLRGEWEDLLSKLRAGEIDMLLAATDLAERREYAWFSEPYRRELFAVFVRHEDLPELRDMSLKQMAEHGKRIGLTSGYFYAPDINEMAYAGPLSRQFVAAPFVDLNYWRLLDGTVDAILADPVAMSAFARRKGLENRISRHPKVIESGEVSLMFSRQSVDEDVVRRFNAALKQRHANGSIDRILARYGS